MHLDLSAAEVLRPSESVGVRGLVGMHEGRRESLVERIARFGEKLG